MVTHLVDVKDESYELTAPSEPYPAYSDRWGPYYDRNYAIVVGSPAYQQYETYDVRKYVLRTNLYDAKTDKLVWTVLTQSEEPTSLRSALQTFANVVVNKAEQDRVL